MQQEGQINLSHLMTSAKVLNLFQYNALHQNIVTCLACRYGFRPPSRRPSRRHRLEDQPTFDPSSSLLNNTMLVPVDVEVNLSSTNVPGNVTLLSLAPNANASTANVSDLFDVTISFHDTDGTNISDKMKVIYQPGAYFPASFKVSKRAMTSRRIDFGCPNFPGFTAAGFQYSQCTPEGSTSQYYIVHCHPQMGSHDGNCEDHELCVSGNPHYATPGQMNVVRYAYCVSHQTFIDIAAGTDLITTDFSARQLQDQLVGAVLTQRDGVHALFAKSLRIRAMTHDVLYNVKTWRTLPGGDENCSECASISLESIPLGTKSIDVDIFMEAGSVSGLLYLLAVPMVSYE